MSNECVNIAEEATKDSTVMTATKKEKSLKDQREHYVGTGFAYPYYDDSPGGAAGRDF